MNKKRKFIEVIGDKEFIGDEYTVPIKCTNWDLFFHLCDLKVLELMLKSNIEDENYEICELIKKHINKKKNEKK